MRNRLIQQSVVAMGIIGLSIAVPTNQAADYQHGGGAPKHGPRSVWRLVQQPTSLGIGSCAQRIIDARAAGLKPLYIPYHGWRKKQIGKVGYSPSPWSTLGGAPFTPCFEFQSGIPIEISSYPFGPFGCEGCQSTFGVFSSPAYGPAFVAPGYDAFSTITFQTAPAVRTSRQQFSPDERVSEITERPVDEAEAVEGEANLTGDESGTTDDDTTDFVPTGASRETFVNLQNSTLRAIIARRQSEQRVGGNEGSSGPYLELQQQAGSGGKTPATEPKSPGQQNYGPPPGPQTPTYYDFSSPISSDSSGVPYQPHVNAATVCPEIFDGHSTFVPGPYGIPLGTPDTPIVLGMPFPSYSSTASGPAPTSLRPGTAQFIIDCPAEMSLTVYLTRSNPIPASRLQTPGSRRIVECIGLSENGTFGYLLKGEIPIRAKKGKMEAPQAPKQGLRIEHVATYDSYPTVPRVFETPLDDNSDQAWVGVRSGDRVHLKFTAFAMETSPADALKPAPP